MRTNIVIDDALIKKVMNYTGLRTKKDVVHYALEEIVRRKERKKILDLQGKVRWEGNLNELRRYRFDDLG
ncbi:MAG: transcriptional regulator of the Arc/MetJ class [Deltaproteobacteria bacterium RBG_13_43_22]|nr:MAG: transcriptional regulator of the Arc/MetJ class [Deltaproteobacteria bacterium RBG_13_43_22]